ncbi:MAG: hypothetical protein JW852_02460 [Spirochaetales bacterium]|nr:hypothetical protein [Spirochaetales bacterium]
MGLERRERRERIASATCHGWQVSDRDGPEGAITMIATEGKSHFQLSSTSGCFLFLST